MKFTEYLKDRISGIIVHFICITIVILIMYLSMVIKVTDFPLGNVLYAYIVAIILYFIYLTYDYSKNKLFYRQFNEAFDSQNIIEAIINISEGKTREQKQMINLLRKLHKAYVGKIYEYEEEKKQRSMFINQWVHQMKTPVSVINLILQEEDPSKYRELLDSIGEENEKISQGLNIMLYNDRINEFNHDFNAEDIDIVSVLREAINSNRKLFIRNKIFPKVTSESAIVHTDRKWIYFVLNQIIVNAIKYTAADTKDKKMINVSLENNDNNVILTIEDNGIGIPKEDIGRIFNAFFTGKNGHKTSESTGMGLYLAKRICLSLGHEIRVESQKGEYTKFFIIFNKGKNIFTIK